MVVIQASLASLGNACLYQVVVNNPAPSSTVTETLSAVAHDHRTAIPPVCSPFEVTLGAYLEVDTRHLYSQSAEEIWVVRAKYHSVDGVECETFSCIHLVIGFWVCYLDCHRRVRKNLLQEGHIDLGHDLEICYPVVSLAIFLPQFELFVEFAHEPSLSVISVSVHDVTGEEGLEKGRKCTRGESRKVEFRDCLDLESRDMTDFTAPLGTHFVLVRSVSLSPWGKVVKQVG